MVFKGDILSAKIIVHLGSYQAQVDAALMDLEAKRIMGRIWNKDHTLWKESPAEISNRLNWLEAPKITQADMASMRVLADEVAAEGYTHAVLLGMGGSSLTPEVFLKTFGVKYGYPDLFVLDSTDPFAVAACNRSLDFSKTLFITSSKSGTTIETISLLKYFYNRAADILGKSQAGKHFVAITDQRSHLADLANNYDFRATFFGDSGINGRYSALTCFGLVPATLIGMDVDRLMECAHSMMDQEYAHVKSGSNLSEGAVLGTILGTMARHGRDKATFVLSKKIASFGNWLEQMIAESTGKEGKGILPVVGEPFGLPDIYGDDRLFIFIGLKDDEKRIEKQIIAVKEAGHPVIGIILCDLYDLGGQFFLWEMATAVAGYWLEINPFDQPNVESSKELVRQMIAAYHGETFISSEVPDIGGKAFNIKYDAYTLKEKVCSLLNKAKRGAYVAVQVYARQTTETDKILKKLRVVLRGQFRLATTIGYGPRFLHSTGQLFKGDQGYGLFIQLIAADLEDIPIPDEMAMEKSSVSFGVLKKAQAEGDRRALIRAGRQVLRIHLDADVIGGLNRLVSSLEKA
jgi:glucose-6-phosphate isomerase